MKKISLALAFALSLSSCALPILKVTPRNVFPENEYSHLNINGTGKLTGQIFLKTVGGDVKYGAGSDISITPKTSYSTQEYLVNINRGLIADPDPRMKKYIKVVQADGSGKFEIDGLASGDYYVYGYVTWQAPSQYGLLPQGGIVTKEIHIENDKTTNVIVTE